MEELLITEPGPPKGAKPINGTASKSIAPPVGAKKKRGYRKRTRLQRWFDSSWFGRFARAWAKGSAAFRKEYGK